MFSIQFMVRQFSVTWTADEDDIIQAECKAAQNGLMAGKLQIVGNISFDPLTISLFSDPLLLLNMTVKNENFSKMTRLSENS